MRCAEMSRHVWNIENIGFWTHTTPIQGPEFAIEGVEDVKFSYSLKVKETKQVTVVFIGSATPTSPCWMPLRVSACVLTPEREEVSLTSKDVDPFSGESTTFLELFSLDAAESECLADLTILIRTAERLVSVPRQITQEGRIPSTKEIRRGALNFGGYGHTLDRRSKDNIDFSEFEKINRRNIRPRNGFFQYRFFLRKYGLWPCQFRFRLSLTDWRGKIRKKGKFIPVLVGEEIVVVDLDFIPLSMVSEGDRNLEKNVRTEIEQSYRIPSPNSATRGSTSDIHCYRHQVVLDSPDNRGDILPKLNRDRWTDLNLLSEDGQSFPVHRCVLVARSRYFEAMLSIDMAEKHKEEILLKGVNSNVLGHLLDFLYSGTFPGDLNVETLVDLYSLANYFEVLELCGFCLHYIMKKLRLSNVMSVLPLTLLCHCDRGLCYCYDLDREVQGLIASNAEEVFQSPTWIQWEEKSPEFYEKFTYFDREERDRRSTRSPDRRNISHFCDKSSVAVSSRAFRLTCSAVRDVFLEFLSSQLFSNLLL